MPEDAVQDGTGSPDIPLDEPMLYHWSVVIENTLYAAFILFFIIVLPLISEENSDPRLLLLIPIAYLGSVAVAAVMLYWRWRRTTVTFRETDLLIVRDTVFKRDQRIPYNKIASINVNRGVINRIIGTSKLMFNINSSVNAITPEAAVVLRMDLADKIRHELSRKMYGSNLDAHTEDNVIPSVVSISNKDIVLHSILSQPTIATIIGAFFLGVSIMEAYSMMIGGGMNATLIVALLMFFSSTVIPMLVQLFHYYNYKIYRIKDTVYIKCGMIRLYNTSFKVNKINAVRLKSPLIARLTGRYFLEAEVVGLGSSEGGNNNEPSPLICPLKDRKTIDAVMSQVIPEFVYERDPIKQPGAAAKTTYVHAAMWSAACMAVLFAIIYWATELGVADPGLATGLYFLSACSIVIFFAHGAFSRRIVEMDTGENHFSFLWGVADRVITTVAYDKVQIVRIKDGPLTRPYGLAKCRVRLLTAAGGGPVVSGYFRIQDLNVIPETVLARIEDGRYDYKAYL